MLNHGAPQGMVMVPLPKPAEGKDEPPKLNPQAMKAQMFGGNVPFMVQPQLQMSAQMPPSEQGVAPNGQTIPMGMVGQFPQMMQMPHQMPGPQGGMPMGYMTMNLDQLRQQMTPQQLQQLQYQMQVLKGMGGAPKNNDANNDQNKKS
jgi:hypothetical protein